MCLVLCKNSILTYVLYFKHSESQDCQNRDYNKTEDWISFSHLLVIVFGITKTEIVGEEMKEMLTLRMRFSSSSFILFMRPDCSSRCCLRIKAVCVFLSTSRSSSPHINPSVMKREREANADPNETNIRYTDKHIIRVYFILSAFLLPLDWMTPEFCFRREIQPWGSYSDIIIIRCRNRGEKIIISLEERESE